MDVARTERLVLRRLVLTDAPFFLRQLNEPSWIANIGDRKLRTLEDAERYIRTIIQAGYEKNGFGMYRVQRIGDGEPVGLCGLVKRDTLPEPDIGFSLLESQWGHGYAVEAARAVMAHARDLGIGRMLAITTPSNEASGRLLRKLGFVLRGVERIGDEDLRVYEFAT